jgi:PKD repeat protein
MKTPILLFLIALLVTSASGSVLSVGNGQVNATSELASMNITLDSAPDGLMDYNLSVTIDDPSIATIKNVEFPPWAITTETSLLPSSFCWLNATTGPGTNITTETTLVTITLEGLSGGTTPVSLAVYSMRDDYSNEINPSIINGTFTVNAPVLPDADFSANTTTGVAPLTYAWDFEDNGTVDAITQNATHTYLAAGNYTVNLTVTGPGGIDSEVRTDYITVTEPPAAPVAAFSANTTSGIAPLTVAFTDASTGAGTKTYEWDFTNDGTVDATTPDAVYTYSSAGTYTVNLTVTNAGGSDSEVKTDYITVTTAPVSPTAAFSANTTSGTAPLTVAFTDASTGTAPLTYAWDFTNDGSVDATTQNATHTYLTAGNYTVNLTVTGPGGTDSEVKSSYITVTSVTPKISAQFTASPVSGRSPLAVRFTDQSIGTITSYEWDFNNDGMVDSRMMNPLKFFTSAGEYTVQLTVRGPDGTDQEVKNQYIDVTAKPLRPIAFFSANTLSGAAPLNVTFTDKSYNNPDSYLWKFGDGTTSTLKNPSHTYPVPGYYKVGLTASNAAGSSSMAMNIYVSRS